ncbi:MAG: CvpA family protein [Verrucomicrobia bacterium]|nr:CvpA family protein [Verrucomicrobiota bacterium]
MTGGSVEASQQWQGGLLIVFAVCVAYSTIHGSFRGLLLQLLTPLAVAVSVAIVYFLADPVLHLFGMSSATISPGGLMLARVLLGILCFYLIMLAGGFLFRRTRDYDLIVSRLISGVGGAFLGFIYGLVSVWFLMILIHVIGRVAEDEVTLQTSRGLSPAPVISTLARAKASLDSGWLGEVSHLLDPVPGSVYDAIDRWSSILSRPDAVNQLLADPVFKPLSNDPTFQALANDPELSSSIQKGDLLGVVTNPKLVQFFTNGEVRQELVGKQWKGARR